MKLLLLALLPAAASCLVSPAGCWLLLLPAAVAFLHDRQLLALQRLQLAEYQVLYPVLINLLTALLQAGFTLHRAFQTSAVCLLSARHNNVQEAGGFLAELAARQRKINSGSPVSDVLQDMMATCPLPEAQAALLLLLRYGQGGEAETIQMLTLQSAACWSLHRNAARKQLEQQSLKLLLPMTLDLVAVLLTALLPAVFSLQAL